MVLLAFGDDTERGVIGEFDFVEHGAGARVGIVAGGEARVHIILEQVDRFLIGRAAAVVGGQFCGLAEAIIHPGGDAVFALVGGIADVRGGWRKIVVVFGDRRTAILPVNGEKHRLDFGGKQAVTGRLLVNGKPLNNVRVQLGGRNPSFGVYKAFAQTDANGEFTFWSPSHGRRTLYYGAPERRNDWIRAGEIFIDSSTKDFGNIDSRSMDLAVFLTGLPEDQASQARRLPPVPQT